MRISDWCSDVCSSDLLVAVVQRRHEAVLGVEGDLVGARQPLAKLSRILARLDRKRDQCAFHGIALDNPAILGLPEVGVVTQQRSPHQIAQHWVYHRLDVGRAPAEGAEGLASTALDPKGPARGRRGPTGCTE